MKLPASQPDYSFPTTCRQEVVSRNMVTCSVHTGLPYTTKAVPNGLMVNYIAYIYYWM